MHLDASDFTTRGGSWMRHPANDGDVVVSTRVRLARNVDGFKFGPRIGEEEQGDLEQRIHEWLADIKTEANLRYFNLKHLEPIFGQMLCERYLISKELASGEGDRGVAFSPSECTCIMTNEEDHLRLQVLRGGQALEKALQEAIQLDQQIEARVPYAYSRQYGYLTTCPTNVGTGLRISVMMHVPALVMAKEFDKVIQSANSVGLTVRGFSGEGTQAVGDLVQLSNQQTLGRTEKEILRTVQALVAKIIEFERAVRKKILEGRRLEIEDRVWRAVGLLRYSRSMSSEEALGHLSAIRLGACLAILPPVAATEATQLVVTTQPGHLQALKSRALTTQERDHVRARILRDRMAEL